MVGATLNPDVVSGLTWCPALAEAGHTTALLIGPPEGGHYEQLRRALATAEIVAEDDRLGDLPLRLAPLPALTLDGQVGFFLGQPEVALQDALGAVEVFPERLETQEAAALVKSRSRNSIPSALARSAAGGPPGDETFE